MTDHTQLLTTALAWHTAGAAVLPVRPDGSKAPAVAWKTYQDTRPDLDQLLAWFGTSHYDGLGILTGHVSGNLEMVEFEGRAVTTGLLAQLEQLADDNDMTDLLALLTNGYSETTPSGGVHLIYRLADAPVLPNTKLARTPDREVLAETRGEGGFVVVAPSFGRTHPTALAWTMFAGSIAGIPTITGDQRDRLWALVRMLDQEPPREPIPDNAPRLPGGASSGTRPGDDYNTRTTWDDILEPRGWTKVFRMGRGYAWRRPGKSIGISATTGQAADGIDRLYVFTTSTEFESERPYSKFAAIALLEHAGDYSAAAKALAGGGYGAPPQQPTTSPTTPTEPAFGPITATHLPDITNVAPDYLTTVTTDTDLDDEPPEAYRGAPAPLLTHPGDLANSPASTLAQSEDGHSQALIAEYGQDIRYCHQMGRWLHWNGHKWAVQAHGGGIVREYAKSIARAYPDQEPWKAHKKRQLTTPGINGALTMTTTDFRIEVSIDDLDARPWELNTPGGTINLRTGILEPANPARLHTRSTLVAPDPGADQAAWLSFLDTTFSGDTAIIEWMQRLLGYACIGEVREHILPIFYGAGANGKTVLLDTVAALLGDYAAPAPRGFLMQGPQQHETEIARLAGIRLVISSETNAGERFDEGKIKLLTGGDKLTARFMRQDHFQFTPSHTIFLVSNHRPEVTSGGDAFWRRAREVPFDHQVPEELRDPELKERLVREHGPAILAWLAQGAAKYAAGGLAEPDRVKQATSAYAMETDTVAQFVDEVCMVGGSAQLNTAVLRAAYERFCVDISASPVSAKAFGQALRAKYGIEVKRANGKRYYLGITALDASTEPDGTLPVEPTDDPWRQR